MYKSKIAITGATGFIGNHLIKRLKKEQLLFNTFNKDKHSFNNVKSLYSLVKGIDTVFHLAGATKSDKESFDFNIKSTKNLLQAIKNVSPGCRVIFASTFAVYKTPTRGEIIDENFKVDPRNNYGLSKLRCEDLLDTYSKNSNIETLSLRLSNVFGPDMIAYRHSVIATFIEQIKNDATLIVTSDGSQTRDFIYIEDVVNALVQAAKIKNISIPIINICSGEETSISQLINLIEEILGKRAKIAFKYEEIRDGGYWKASNALAEKVLEWTPQVSLKEGLQLTANNSKNN